MVQHPTDTIDGTAQARYRKFDRGTPLYVIFERHVGENGEATEELWEQGLWEVCWVQNKNPPVRELEAARWLLSRGLGREDWAMRLEEIVRILGHED